MFTIGGVMVLSALAIAQLALVIGRPIKRYAQTVPDGAESIKPTHRSAGTADLFSWLNGMLLDQKSKGLVNTVRRAKRDVALAHSSDGPVAAVIAHGRAKFSLCDATIADALVVRNWVESEFQKIPDLRKRDAAMWMPRVIGAILYNTHEERDLRDALTHTRGGAFSRRLNR